ncbi:hypothetical protein DFR58_11355 [Anaerobacterium chartisolvens]|uniref:Uncharacterized protein n=1 Tax=Anaerobacterium chartisolvens TaxID=1297424 RepID=A0A369B713_9FIRM|nr:hypothetical protein [Anaerobacterium chartisolvens]RCX15474.1 hypothetical protein DFR58_11355 [Anaerobacterium chartisolvens]
MDENMERLLMIIKERFNMDLSDIVHMIHCELDSNNASTGRVKIS